jgi:hypothetical protein
MMRSDTGVVSTAVGTRRRREEARDGSTRSSQRDDVLDAAARRSDRQPAAHDQPGHFVVLARQQDRECADR